MEGLFTFVNAALKGFVTQPHALRADAVCNRMKILAAAREQITLHGSDLAAGTKTIPFDEDVWELYDGSKDYSQANDLSREIPDKLHELEALWLEEARKYNAIPLDDRAIERLVPDLAGRPLVVKGDRQIFYAGMARITEASVLNIKTSRSTSRHSWWPQTEVRAGLSSPRVGASAAGACSCTKVLPLCLQPVRHQRVRDRCRPAGAGSAHQVRAEFAYAGEGYAKGGDVTLYYDGEQVGEGNVRGHTADDLLGDRRS